MNSKEKLIFPQWTIEEIFKDYSGRRTALIRALTEDFEEVYKQCDPDNDDCLCLYGYPNETWEVTTPEEYAPPMLPEPVLGINFPRENQYRMKWLSEVAMHSDSWLLSVAFYLGVRLNSKERSRLFSMINDLPTVYEAVVVRKPSQDKPIVYSRSGSRSRGTTKRSGDVQVKSNLKVCG